MANLTTCLQKVGAKLDPADKAAVMARSRELRTLAKERGEPMSATDAAIQAAKDVISEIRAELKAAEPAQPAQRKSAHPKTVMGSELLAIVSARLGGLDPSLISEFSVNVPTGKFYKNGVERTEWRNPMIPGVGKLFRRGGRQDRQEIAQVLEDADYLEPGAVANDYKEAGERAKELIKAALDRNIPKTLSEQQAEMEASQEAERKAYYDALDEESAIEADAERAAIMAEASLGRVEMDAVDDADLFNMAGGQTGAEAMRAFGFSEQEIADELAREAGAQAETAQAGAGQDAQAPAGAAPAAGPAGVDAAQPGPERAAEGLARNAPNRSPAGPLGDVNAKANKGVPDVGEVGPNSLADLLGNVDAARALRSELEAAFGTNGGPFLDSRRGAIAVQSVWLRSASDADLARLTEAADRFNAPIIARGLESQDSPAFVKRMRAAGFETYTGMLEAGDRNVRDVAIAMVRPGGGITATTPLLSRGLGRGTPLPTLKPHIDAITAKMPGLRAKVEVVATVTDLPKGIVDSLRSMNALGTVRGLRMPDGRVFLVADKLDSRLEAEFVLFHEVFGHEGLRAILTGDEYARAMTLVRLSNKAVAAEADRWTAAYGADQIEARIQAGASPEAARREVRLLAIEEALADRAGKNDPPAVWKNVMAAIQKALRRMGMNDLANWLENRTEAETYALLMQARKAITNPAKVHAFTPTTSPLFQRVWHGTPHEFDKFDTSKIGTGEGAQAYGYGLYFASRREVAEHYRKVLSKRGVVRVNGKELAEQHGMFAAQIRNIADAMDDGMSFEDARKQAVGDMQFRESYSRRNGYADDEKEAAAAVASLKALTASNWTTKSGQLLEVEIPEDGEMLLWDRPLSEQSEKVRKALMAAMDRNPQDGEPAGWAVETGARFYRETLQEREGSAQAASEWLQNAGIKGIKYLDGVSRNKPLRDVKREFLAELPEDAGFDEVMELIGTGTFSPKNEAVLRALADNDWLGFDYPAQAISTALSSQLSNFDPSPELVQAVAATQDDSTYNYVIFSGDDVAIQQALLSRRPPPLAPAVTVQPDENGNPEFAGDGVVLAYPQPAERFEFIPGPGQRLLNYAIMPAEGFDSMGFVELVVENGRVTSLMDIEINGAGRRAGVGRKVIETILAANPDADVNISNIVHQARGFWAKMGVPEQNLEDGAAYDGTLNWQTFSQAQNARRADRAGARGRAAGEGRNAQAEGGAPGAAGQAPGQVGNALFSRADIGRRDFMMGVAATLASAPASADVSIGKARPISEADLRAKVTPAAEKLLRGNGATNIEGAKALKEAIAEIAANGPVSIRALAREVGKLIPNDRLMLTVNDTRRVNAHGVVEFSTLPHMTLFTAEGRQGLTNSTVLHEALHAAVLARYQTLSTAVIRSNDSKLKMDAPAAAAALEQFRSLWDEFRQASRGAKVGDTDLELSLEQARGSPDEFFVRAMTDAKLQAWMAGQRYEGKTLLERFKDWIKTSLFGFSKSGTAPSWLDAALMATSDLNAAMVKDNPDFKRLAAINNFSAQKSAMFSRATGMAEPWAMMELEIGPDGVPIGLADIEIKPEYRGRDIGAKVVEAILAAHPGLDLDISNIVEGARGFWSRLGIPEQNRASGEAYDGTLNWQAYAQAANDGRAAQVGQGMRGETGQDDGRRQGSDRRAEGGSQAPVLSQQPPAQGPIATTAQKNLPATRAAIPASWRDPTNRLQFAPGEWLYNALGRLAAPLLIKMQFKAATPEMRRQLRQMKLDVQKAQDVAVAVANDTAKLSDVERQMVSDIIEREVAAGTVPPAHAVRLAAMMNQAMGEQSKELVRLGMLTQEAADRWDGAYLPRFYESKLKKQVGDAWADAVKRLGGRTSVMKGVKGSHLKSRGIYEPIIARDLEKWEQLGWEIRDPDYPAGTKAADLTARMNAGLIQPDEPIQMWRDYTRTERDKMGEIRDAGFRFVMGYMQTQRDIALGRMFEKMANDPASSSRIPQEGWVKVPDSTIEGTGAKRYGKLSGRYVPRETLSHLSQIEESQSAAWQFYRQGMAIWKMGKTAMNPVSHMNNVLSNLTMAHFAGVGYHRADKYVAAIKDFATAAPAIKEARDAGLFLGTMSDAELMNTLPKELQELAGKAESSTVKGAKRVFDLMTFFLRKPMGAAYQAEDTFFRYLIYKDARGRGLSPDDAIDYAQKFIFTYDDLPKGARMVRDFGIPFFAYTYKAVPALLSTALTHPVRFAAPAAALWAANAFAYAVAAGDDDDTWAEILSKYLNDEDFRKKVREQEKLERDNLPPWMKGTTALSTPKAIRLGMDEVTKLPLFIDVARIIPGGDIFDVSPNAGGIPLPQPITPSHPLFSIATGMIANKDLWTGKELVDKNDTRIEAAEKRSEWMWKQISPAMAIGNYHWERGMNALAQASGGEIKWLPEFVAEDYTGVGRDRLPVQPGLAAMQTFGIKVRPIDIDKSIQMEGTMREKMIRDITAELRTLNRLNQDGVISDTRLEKERAKTEEKVQRLREGLTVDGDARP